MNEIMNMIDLVAPILTIIVTIGGIIVLIFSIREELRRNKQQSKTGDEK